MFSAGLLLGTVSNRILNMLDQWSSIHHIQPFCSETFQVPRRVVRLTLFEPKSRHLVPNELVSPYECLFGISARIGLFWSFLLYWFYCILWYWWSQIRSGRLDIWAVVAYMRNNTVPHAHTPIEESLNLAHKTSIIISVIQAIHSHSHIPLQTHFQFISMKRSDGNWYGMPNVLLRHLWE